MPREPASERGARPSCVGPPSKRPRCGSFSDRMTTGVNARPLSPMIRKVARQPNAAVSWPPRNTPSMLPSGSDSPQTAIARARRCLGKKSEIIE